MLILKNPVNPVQSGPFIALQPNQEYSCFVDLHLPITKSLIANARFGYCKTPDR